MNEEIDKLLHEAKVLAGTAVGVRAIDEAALNVQTAIALATVRVAEALERNNQLLEESLRLNFPERGNGRL